MKGNNFEESGESLKRKADKGLFAVKICAIGLMCDLAALAIFLAAAVGTGFKDNSPEGFLIGAIVFLALAVAIILALAALFIYTRRQVKLLIRLEECALKESGETEEK